MRTGHLHEYEVPGEWPALSGGGETEGPGCQQGIINGSLTPGGPWLGSHSPYPVLTVAAHHPPPRSPISIPTPTGSPGPSCLPPPPEGLPLGLALGLLLFWAFLILLPGAAARGGSAWIKALGHGTAQDGGLSSTRGEWWTGQQRGEKSTEIFLQVRIEPRLL